MSEIVNTLLVLAGICALIGLLFSVCWVIDMTTMLAREVKRWFRKENT